MLIVFSTYRFICWRMIDSIIYVAMNWYIHHWVISDPLIILRCQNDILNISVTFGQSDSRPWSWPQKGNEQIFTWVVLLPRVATVNSTENSALPCVLKYDIYTMQQQYYVMVTIGELWWYFLCARAHNILATNFTRLLHWMDCSALREKKMSWALHFIPSYVINKSANS